MNLLASISVAAFAINLFVAVFVLLHDRRRLRNQVFFLSGCCLAAWSLATFVLAQPVAAADATRWMRLMMACSAIAPALVLHLVLLLFGAPHRRLLTVSYSLAILLVAMSSFGFLDGGARQLTSMSESVRWYGKGNVLTWLLPINAFSLGGYGITVLYRTVRESHGIRRAQAYYFLVGIAPCLLAGLNDFAGGYFTTYPGTHVTFTPVIPLASAFWAVLVGYTIHRYRLIDLDAAITRGVVRALTSAVLLIPFFLLLLAAQQAYHGEVYLDFSMLIVAICAIAAFVVPRLSAAAEQKIGDALLGASRHYREALVAFSQEATRILELDTLLERVTETLTETLGATAAAVYVADGIGAWRLGGQRDYCVPRLPKALRENDALISWLRSTGAVAVREELQIEAAAGRDRADIVSAMSGIDAEVMIPLTTPEALEGIILLGPRRDGAVFTQEDLEVLTILANQLATAMSNARLYADLKRSREIIQRSERLSAIGTMAAGLAHEIRNPLVSIRTFTQLLPERLDDAEFRDTFFELTLSEVDRICALINELLAFARPAPAELCEMDVNNCLERICLLLDTQARDGGVSLSKKLYQNELEVIADEDQIKQVIMNVVMNAIQACGRRGTGGQVEVSSYPNRVEQADYVCIEVSDNGNGIDEDIVARIFDPFFTTRTEGTGLGLSIAHQIITRHGGFIDVRTDPSKGTSFYLNLPVEPVVMEPVPSHYDSRDLSLHG